ncbi:MAG: ATP-binding protein [Candidatus Lokiarchaeota archaeon]|nr:ATP-binding protein [Candidatus Harpocratesius repetitus]
MNISKENLRKIVEEQYEMIIKKPVGIPREKLSIIAEKKKATHVIIITGLRRCGKSTFLRQIMHFYYHDENFYYLNFDDERLVGCTSEDFDLIYEVLLEQFGDHQVFFFDEIQNVPKFERFIRRLHDLENKIYLTGSNATLLSSEISTKLTGRHLDIELFPFSFREYLKLKDVEINNSLLYTTKGRGKIIKLFDNYLHKGGMPEFLKINDYEILQRLYEDILIKDITVRYKIQHVRELREIVKYLFSNIGQKTNYSRLCKLVNIRSPNTVKNYLDYLQLTYLGFLIPKLDYSVKKQIVSGQKYYAIDLGIVEYISVKLSRDLGWALENLVFLSLRRKYPISKIFYYDNGSECDFVIRNEVKVRKAIQVSYFLDEHNKKREIEGLLKIMKHFNLDSGLILTYEQEEELDTPAGLIHIIPVWKWLLQE